MSTNSFISQQLFEKNSAKSVNRLPGHAGANTEPSGEDLACVCREHGQNPKGMMCSDLPSNRKLTISPENQDAKVAQLLVMGNIVTSNRARQGKLTGITA